MNDLLQDFSGQMQATAEQRLQDMMRDESGRAFNANLNKNRYTNIIPYLHSQPSPTRYFNGNIVKIGSKNQCINFLVTQAPLDGNDFHLEIAEFAP